MEDEIDDNRNDEDSDEEENDEEENDEEQNIELSDRKRALHIFQFQPIVLDIDDDKDPNLGRYLIIFENLMQFKLLVGYISCGFSFKQYVNVVQQTKEQTNLGQLGHINL